MVEIKGYLKSLEIEFEVVKEIHNMRLAQLDV
ncbi:hypothetical protein JOC34_000246 [Virgibacillus halotolerans]|nr:hypothetical protein [Virgibacillus halotolerans]